MEKPDKRNVFSKQQQLVKQHIPEMNQSNETTQRLFIVLSEGNIPKIKQFISVNNAVISTRNEKGESALHAIIGNTALTTTEKTQMVEFLVMFGVPVNAFDEKNITPLHLACKYQLFDIATKLIELGANPQAQDSKYMTPLHYAVQGTYMECSPTKIKSLVPAPKQQPKTKDYTNISDGILALLKQPGLFNRMMTHLGITIQDSFPIFESKITERLNDMKTKIVGLYSGTNQTKQTLLTKIKKMSVESVSDIVSLLDKNIGNTLKNEDIKRNIPNGWGPSQTDQLTKILPYDSQIYLQNSQNDLNTKLNTLFTGLVRKKQAIVSKINESLLGSINDIDSSIDKIIQLDRNFASNALATRGPVIVYGYDNPLNDVRLDMVVTVAQGNKFIHDYTDLLSIDGLTRLPSFSMMNDLTEQIPPYPGPPANNDPSLFSPSNITIARGTTEDIATAQKNHTPVSKYDLSYDTEFGVTIFGIGPTNAVNEQHITNNSQFTGLTYNTLVPGWDVPNQGSHTYFMYPIRHYIDYIIRELGNIEQYFANVKVNIIRDKYYLCYLHLCYIVTMIVNCLMTLNALANIFCPLAESRLSILATNASTLANNFSQVRSRYTYLLSHIIETGKSLQPKYSELLKGISQTFISLVEYKKMIENFIEHINKMIGFKLVMNYTDIATINADTFNDNEIIRNGIFKGFPPFPASVEELNNFTQMVPFVDNTSDYITPYQNPGPVPANAPPTLLQEAKKRVYERFMPHVNKNNIFTYHGNTQYELGDVHPDVNIIGLQRNPADIQIAQTDGQSGWILHDQQTPTLSNNPPAPPPIPAHQLSFRQEIIAPNELPPPRTHGPNARGSFGFVPNNPHNYTNIITQRFPVMASVLEQYVTAIKLTIMQDIVILANRELTTGRLANYQMLASLVETIRTTLGVANQEEINSTCFTILCGVINTVIDNFVRENTIALSTKIVNNFLLGLTNNVSFPIDLQPLQPTDMAMLYKQEVNVSYKLNEIINTYMGNVTEVGNLARSLLSTSVLVDEPSKQEFEKEIYNYTFSQNEYSKQCLKINPNIIKLLLDKKARINHKDISGSSPIMYSIQFQDVDVVKLLLSRKADVSTNQIENNSGYTPIKLLIKILNNQHSLFVSNNDINLTPINDILFGSIKDNITKKSEFGYNIITGIDQVFPMVIFMTNHYLFNLTNDYARSFTYQDKKKLLNLLKTTIGTVEVVTSPIMKQTPAQYQEQDGTLKIMRGAESKTVKEISKLSTTLLELRDRLKNFTDELDDTTDLTRRNLLTQKIFIVNNAIQDMDNQLNQNQNLLMTIQRKISDRLMNQPPPPPQVEQTERNVVTIYENIFAQLNNSVPIVYGPAINVKNYQNLWGAYIKKQPGSFAQNNFVNIHLAIQLLFRKLQKAYVSKEITTASFKENIDLISKWSKNISEPFAKEYFELPDKLGNQNPSLDTMFNILVHSLTYSLFNTFYLVIMKMLAQYINEKLNLPTTRQDTKIAKLDELLAGIIESSKLMEYVIKILPRKITKKLTNIYEENDADKDENLVDTYYETIIDYIVSNTAYPLTKDTQCIVDIKTYIFPYFKDLIEQFVTSGKKFMDNYMAFMINESKNYEILSELLKFDTQPSTN